ncbi:MAG: hypothetical protein AAFN10_11890 [Bacteroidota bacterium]
MRHLHISLFTVFLLSSMALFAQVPQSINYQAMAFDGIAVYANQTFDIRFTLHLSNTTVYEETHFSTTSNSQGLFVLKIGQGVPSSGTFADIDWSGGPYSLRTELDAGSGYVLISDHSLSSVPYALYAERSSLPVEDELSFNGDTLQIAQNGATLGQVLKWDGQDWVPDFDAVNNFVAGTGINVSGSVISNTGDTNAGDDITTTSNAGGDVSGVFSSLTVNALQGNPLSSTIPANNDVLKWNAITLQWEPSPDAVSTGGAFNVTARLSGDGSIGSPLDIAQNGAINDQVLKWDDITNTWLPADDSASAYGLQLVGNTLALVPGGTMASVSLASQYTAGAGINLVGGTIINTGDIDPSDDITSLTSAGGDLSGLYPNPTVNGLAGFPLSSQSPGLNQILKFNGTTWVPSTDDDTDADADPTNEIQSLAIVGGNISISGGNSVPLPVYLQGAGIDITNNVITNTGDLDPNDDITFLTPAGGDLSGVYPNPVVSAINGFSIANTTPSLGQVYKWNGTQWIPAADEVDDADADPTNEIQTLSSTGNIVTLSNGGGSVTVGTAYNAGPGINIIGGTIVNTGDTDASDDINTSTSAAGDVSGNFPTLTVEALQGNPLANTAPASGEVLKWNGTQWVPSSDEAGPWTETAGTAIHDGDMALQNMSGQTRVAAGISPNDRGFINVYDEFNNLKAGIQVNASGQGEVFGDFKSFRIDHPEDPTKEIWYANLEGPEAGAYARGTAELVNGQATISFPDHFQLIATADNMTIMLTPLSGDSEGLAVIEKTTQGFVVKELRGGTGNYRFDWEAKCIRQGYENFEVIRDRK